MAVRAASGGQVLSLDTLVRLRRGLQTPGAHQRLPVPEGMTAPLGCDAVEIPARFGPLLMPRLPRAGCVYADETHWWWLVPSDSDYALEWPLPAQLRHRGGGLRTPRRSPTCPPAGRQIPYTPPIPLYPGPVPGHGHDAHLVTADRRVTLGIAVNVALAGQRTANACARALRPGLAPSLPDPGPAIVAVRPGEPREASVGMTRGSGGGERSAGLGRAGEAGGPSTRGLRVGAAALRGARCATTWAGTSTGDAFLELSFRAMVTRLPALLAAEFPARLAGRPAGRADRAGGRGRPGRDAGGESARGQQRAGPADHRRSGRRPAARRRSRAGRDGRRDAGRGAAAGRVDVCHRTT